jgi:hypothetical protein
MANKKISDKTKEELKPVLVSYTKMLLTGLVEEKVIHEINSPKNNQEITYELVKDLQKKVRTDELALQDNKLMLGFVEFREVMLNVYTNLNSGHSEEAQQVTLSKAIEYYEKLGLFQSSISNTTQLKNLIIQVEGLLNDSRSEKEAIKLFKEHNLNFSLQINRLLEFYAQNKASQFFKDFTFDNDIVSANKSRSRMFDIVGQNESGPDLIFEVKYRKRTLTSIKEMLFQGYEYLTKYDNESGKKNYLILINFTNEDVSSFEKIRNRFYQNLKELFPNFVNKIFFILISTKQLNLIDNGFSKLDIQMWDAQIDTLKFSDKPKIITNKEEVTIDSKFLQQTQGSFATWIKLRPIQDYYTRQMNFEYVISHASYNYKELNGQYQNVFALALAPNTTNISGNNPTSLTWRVWIANAERMNLFLYGEPLTNAEEKWYHLLVRWNHILSRIEFLIDGKVVEVNTDYKSYWPNEIMDTVFIGTWGNRENMHYIKLPLYRLVSSSQFLSNTWVEAELKNKPNV